MKKIKFILLAIMMFVFVGCGTSKPKNMSSEAYDIGVQICDILQGYIDGQMEMSTCSSGIESLYGDLLALPENTDEDHYLDDLLELRIYGAIRSIERAEDGETFETIKDLESLKDTLKIK